MDLDKFRNAKSEKEEVERLQKEKEEAEELALKAKQEALIKQYVDKLTKPIIEPRINNITDEKLDELLVKNIFEEDNESDSYILPIKIDLGLLEINFDWNRPNYKYDKDYLKKYPDTEADWIEETISIYNSYIYIFNEDICISTSNVREYFHYSENLDEEERKDPTYEDDDYHYEDIMRDVSITNWLSEALKTTTNAKYLFETEEQDDFSYTRNVYFNIHNEKTITDALIKRLEEYGLKILDVKVDDSIEEDCKRYYINYEIKFKNPLK